MEITLGTKEQKSHSKSSHAAQKGTKENHEKDELRSEQAYRLQP